MGEATQISWCDSTFNPWWGCTKVSAGCDNCFAETFSLRIGKDIWGKDAERRFFGDAHWAEPLKWERHAAEADRPILVFCASMCDVFEPRSDLDSWRERLWALIDDTPHLIWQLLTKRPEQARSMVPRAWMRGDWPAHVWCGTTVENGPQARLRIPRLLRLPAPVRFLSCEPLLGPVDLSRWLPIEWMDALRPPDDPVSFRGEGGWGAEMFGALRGDRAPIQWVICGGESGNGFRPLDVAYARDLRDQCAAVDVPFFFKQHGGRTPHAGGDLLDGVEHKAFPPEARR